MGTKTSECMRQLEFMPDTGVAPRVDYISRDGNTLLWVQRGSTGTRGIHVGAMRLALSLGRRSGIQRACLVLVDSHLSRSRLWHEWHTVTGLFVSDIAERLSLVVIGAEDIWTEPEDECLQQIVHALPPDLLRGRQTGDQETVLKPAVGQKFFDLVKVLLCRWLRREGAIPLGKLAKQVGCTYPTVAQAMVRLERSRSIIRHSNRSVELGRFPRETWNELLALSGPMRRSFRFMDASGEKPDLQYLLERLERLKPPGVALSGVVAARYWQPDFDLHGLPRLDLLLHTPQGLVDLGFMRRLDPALKHADNEIQPAVVVVHPLLRRDSLFADAVGEGLPVADPVETVLDLHELGLTVQAGQLLTHLRPEVRLP